MSEAVLKVDLPGIQLFRRGKVRDVYDLGEHLLFVTTDRISAFDVVLPNGIPDKGKVLTQLSAFWFARTPHIVPNHLVTTDVAQFPPEVRRHADQLRGRSMLVQRAERIDFECVVRGYLAGSGWVEYRDLGTVCGAPLPPGLRESDALPGPIFTPATKAASGHDININVAELAAAIGGDLAERLAATSIALYRFAAELARQRGIIIADTKFELGFLDGQLLLIDEVLTPDSSRFWDAATSEPGEPQPSFDKQYVRDWLIASGWNREPPAPVLPADVVERTAAKYREAYRRITGQELSS
ncbi:MAG: phosphoribosylaminoimidazolesuccinocarboxamide synthase [Chloroflexi bacterium]|nr:phosphoribosylaminoimidazolesuccinocarboxamide synthase [Chloroflexota bacterium]